MLLIFLGYSSVMLQVWNVLQNNMPREGYTHSTIIFLVVSSSTGRLDAATSLPLLP